MDRALDAVKSAIDGFIRKERHRLVDEPAERSGLQNLLQAMVAAADESGSGIDDAQAAGCVMTMLLAGEYTTANTLAWCLLLLHRHPQAPQLPLLALKGAVVGEIAVPKGTVIISLMRHDSIDDAHVPEAQAFRSERWLGKDGLSPGSAKRISVPFGAGPRICAGRDLTLQEMKMVLLKLLNHFDSQFVGTVDGGEQVVRLMFAMVPVGLRMRLRAIDSTLCACATVDP